MIRIASLLLVVLSLPLFAGCSIDNVRQGLYEGFRVRNDLQSTPPERAGKPDAPDFQEYERMKNEQRQ